MKKHIHFIIDLLILAFILSGCSAVSYNPFSKGKVAYYQLSEPQTIIKKGPEGSFDYDRTHTLTIVELNKGGYRFWGYYTGFDGKNMKHDVGLAYSNDLVNWIKDGSIPVVSNLRWPTAVVVDGIINIFGTRDYGSNSYIVRLVSEDGKSFTEVEKVVSPSAGQLSQNPYIFYDEPASVYRLYYFHKENDKNYIMEKHSSDIAGLAASQPNKIMSRTNKILAAPSMMYRDGKYWLAAETLIKKGAEDVWATLVFTSDDPLGTFVPAKNNELLVDNDACYFQYIFDNQLNGVYSHEYKDKTWEIFSRTHEFQNRNSIDLDITNVNIGIGETLQLKASAVSSDGARTDTASKATWATSDNSVVKVKKGVITAVSKGSAIITVSYGGCSATATITVED